MLFSQTHCENTLMAKQENTVSRSNNMPHLARDTVSMLLHLCLVFNGRVFIYILNYLACRVKLVDLLTQ